MDVWLTTVRDALARAARIPADELDVAQAAEVELLDLARIAAHESGARTNAPLLCYLVGRAERGVPLEELARAVRDASVSVPADGE